MAKIENNVEFVARFRCPDCDFRINSEFDRWDIDAFVDEPGCNCCGPRCDISMDMHCPECGSVHVIIIRGD